VDQSALKNLLHQLIAKGENETVDFKRTADTDKIGRYFSALSNEANLQNLDTAWLILGVDDKSRDLIGCSAYLDNESRTELKKKIAQNLSPPSMNFRNIHILEIDQKKIILLFEIPPAPLGIPVFWKKVAYARSGDSIDNLSIGKQDQIRNQEPIDWSSEIVPEATLEDLDEEAVQKARHIFAQKNPNFNDNDVKDWATQIFLDRAHLTRQGKITKSTLLLLGKAESSSLLSPHPARITWKLEDHIPDYAHFDPPFLLSVAKLYQKIRNRQISLLPRNQLLSVQIQQYDQKVILEALNNCIAHQDYRKNARIIVHEKPDKLIFINSGSFFDRHPNDYIEGDSIPLKYRNSFLTKSMSVLGMIDTVGYGIYQIHKIQRQRHLPMPDYDLSEADKVSLTIYGNVIDSAYSQLLMENTDLSLLEIISLDRLQKKRPISAEMTAQLKRKGLIEGRKPNFYIAPSIAKTKEDRTRYMMERSIDDNHYKKLILDYLKKFKAASKNDLDDFLKLKISDRLNDAQKIKKIANLLTSLRREGVIYNNGSKKYPSWKISKNDKLQNKRGELQNKK
jgi:ATP-dependent DNA helicase RecG